VGAALRPRAASCLRPRGMYIYSVLAGLRACGLGCLRLAAFFAGAGMSAGCGSSARGRSRRWGKGGSPPPLVVLVTDVFDARVPACATIGALVTLLR